jgi:glucose/arabinose dehydrogenase
MDFRLVHSCKMLLFTILISSLLLSAGLCSSQEKIIADAQEERDYPESALPSTQGPIIKDPTLKAELVFKGLKTPTDMAFLSPDSILVTEKDTGIVRRIVNGVMLQEPLLDLNVATYGHRGLLGIAISNGGTLGNDNISNKSNSRLAYNANMVPKYVFLYYTAAQEDDHEEDTVQGEQPLGNVVYRYELVNNKLTNPILLLDLPAGPGAIGNGGKILIDPKDKNLYITIGGVGIDDHKTKAQNIKDGEDPDGTSGILVIDQDGKAVSQNGTLGNKDPLNKYFAYGLWNSFGIDFDPLTGNLWDTENGVIFGDEINLVYPGFNSGWNKIDGIWLRGYTLEDTESHAATNQTIDDLLADFGGKGKYSPPEITWFDDIGPTAIRFLNSDKLGKQYENDMFVGDIINGNLYHFDLNEERSELKFPPNSPLHDKVLDSNETRFNNEMVFAKGFGGITDIEVGPKDGYLYILTFHKDEGTIYRIMPKS